MSAKLTPWFEPGTFPVRVGEYATSPDKFIVWRRWFDGVDWSAPYFDNDSEGCKNACRKRLAAFGNGSIFWRGLASNPAANKEGE